MKQLNVIADNVGVQGKVEMEIELLTGEEAVGKPAGQGRDEPNMNPTLEPPK